MSIQVVPREVIEDQQATRLADVVQNVSGVRPGSTFGNRGDSVILRGFQAFMFARDGVVSNQLFGDLGLIDLANVERLEILKGPASVLYGLGDPGGLVNIVTKRPLRAPFAEITGELGSESFKRGALDLSHPLTRDGALGFRVNAAYQDWGSFRDFFKRSRREFAAPVLGWQIGDATTLLVDLEYMDQELPFDRGLVAVGNRVADVPLSRYLGEAFSTFDVTGRRTRYLLEHHVNETWQLRHSARIQSSEARRFSADPRGLQADNRTLNRRAFDQRDKGDQWTLQFEAVGDFTRAYAGHRLLLGVERAWIDKDVRFAIASLAPIDIFNPMYGAQPGTFGPFTQNDSNIEYTALYLQDQIWLGGRWKLLLGGRYDDVDQNTMINGVRTDQRDRKFSPRAGIMYDLKPWASLYAAYSRSFLPVTGTTFAGEPFKPEQGKQYEAGVKMDFLDGRLGATLAVFELKRRNVETPDPANPGFSIQTGEQRSRGVELDLSGELRPGWKLIAAAAYTDAEVTKDNQFTPGNRIQGVPRLSGSLWTTYEFLVGDLRGLGFGAGVLAVGDREGDLANTFQVPGYARVDASVFYRGQGWRATLGVKNVFDEEYIESPVSRTEIYPGAPRAFLATLEIRL